MGNDAMDLEFLLQRREAAEAERDDLELLRLREFERACSELPPVIDGARLSQLICGDPISTTWTAWRPTTGERLLIRCLHARWRRDPVMLRQLQRDLVLPENHSLHRAQHHPDGDWPHNRLVLTGPRLSEFLPLEDRDPGDPLLMTRVLLGGLAGLATLHEAGLAHGPDLIGHLFFRDGEVGVAWLGRFGEVPSLASDICELATAAASLCREGMQPIRQLADSWASEAPSSALDAGQLLTRAMASTLLDTRHRLWIAHRHQHRRQRIGRLAVVIGRLQRALPPPPGRVCLRAQKDGQLVIAAGNGVSFHGQASSDPTSQDLQQVYSPDSRLNPVASRFLLRAWAMRHRGDEERRAQIQAQLGADDHQAEAMMRWLSGMARLRAASLLLRAENKIHERASDSALVPPL